MSRIALTKNFHLDEFGAPPVSVYENVRLLALQLQRVRFICGKPILIGSGYRDPATNDRVGGQPDSQHLLGKAADLIVVDPHGLAEYTFADGRKFRCWSGERLAGFFDALMLSGDIINGGLGTYVNRVHYDTRDRAARWLG